jgi:hypothetical protein
MSGNEMFVSALRSAGDEAGVFEYDGETGYFYLYATKCKENEVLGAICVVIGVPDFGEIDVAIRWNAEQSKVGLFIRGRLWAAFDGVTGAKWRKLS